MHPDPPRLRSIRAGFRDRFSARILRDACWERIEDQPGSTVWTKPGKKKYDVATARGVTDYTSRFYRDDLRWLVIVARAPVETVARCIAEQSGAARWEKDARDRYVLDGRWGAFVLKLRERCETLALIVSGAPSMPSGMGSDARRWSGALAREADTPVVLFDTGAVEVYRGGAAADRDAWDPQDDERYEGLSGREREWAREESFANRDGWFASRNIFIPPAEDAGDGLAAKLWLRGIEKDDVERMDVVVFDEHAE